VEADLQRFYGIDYRDRWHPDRRRRLTLRRIAVLVLQHPPLDGNVVMALNGGEPLWRREHHLLDDIRVVIEAVLTDKKHQAKPAPGRPTAETARRLRRDADPDRRKKIADARRRSRDRRRAREAGELPP
jgi:hypothetical protein